MDRNDDDLKRFKAEGIALPPGGAVALLDHDGASIWYAQFGSGPAVILLHGGLGHSGNWGHQVPALVDAGYRAVVIDSRGHGRSTRDETPFSYKQLAGDALAIMDRLGIDQAGLIGWSDGACTAMMLAMGSPERVAGVLYFGCNMDPSGAKDFKTTPVVDRCYGRHVKDYAALSATPEQFQPFADAVGLMQRTQPNSSAQELAAIAVPVTIVQSEHDEFITIEHAQYLAETIPGAELIVLPEVSHFAPVQRPDAFNAMMLGVVGGMAF